MKNFNFAKILAVSINNININKTKVSNKLPFGKQDFIFFIGYKDAKKIRTLCIFSPKIYIKQIFLKLDVRIF